MEMRMLLALPMFVLLSFGAETSAASRVPMVAFLCNRPAMHLTENGWVSDESTNCLRDQAEILDYCRKIYPMLTIQSVAKTGSNVAISNWCHFGHHKCSARYSVRPFLCVVSNSTHGHSFASAKPTERISSTTKPAHVAHAARTPNLVLASQPDKNSFPHLGASSWKEVPFPAENAEAQSDMAEEEMNRYLKQSGSATEEVKDDRPSEHENFERVMADLEKRHRNKVAKMMSEWAMARQKVQEIKRTDEKGAEKFNKEITARFQKAYESLEREGVRERTKMIAVHHDRVQTVLDDKRKRAYEHFLESVDERRPNPSRIMKALTHYVKCEQKERMHAIKHYHHAAQEVEELSEAVSKTDDVEKQEEVFARLKESEARVQRAMMMIGRLPELEKTVHVKIEQLLSSYPSVNDSMAQIISSSKAVTPSTSSNQASGMESHHHKHQPTPVGTRKSQASVITAAPGTNSSRPMSSRRWTPLTMMVHDARAVHEAKHQNTGENTPAPPRHHQAGDEDVKKHVGSSDVSLHHHDVTHRVIPAVQVHASHVEKNPLVANEIYIKKTPMKSTDDRHTAGMHVAAPLGVAIAGATVFAVLVIGVALLRQRNASESTLQRPKEDVVDEAAGQQDVGASDAGQPIMNGYENPTYRYYEAKV